MKKVIGNSFPVTMDITHMVPRNSLKVQYGDGLFIVHAVLTEPYKMANTRFETERVTYGPSLLNEDL